MEFFVAIDAGTGSGKCLIFDREGRLQAQVGEAWSYHVTPDPEFPSVKRFAFDPEHFWSILCRCVKSALQRSGIDPACIVGVAATSQREACVFLGPDGREVYAGPNLDSRGFREGLEILAELGGERLYQITGHSAPFIFPLARYLWFRKHGGVPVSSILMMSDWILWRLAGTRTAEPSNAAESMLFDVAQRTWSDEILRTFDIPRSVLPEVRQSGEQVGTVLPEAAKATGLLAGTPVFLGGADTQCSLLGAGAIEPGDIGATLGTTTPVQAVTRQLCLDPGGALWAGCHVVPDRWVLESNAGDTGDAYLWLIDLLRGERERDVARKQLEKAASELPDTQALLFVGPSVFDMKRIALRRPGGILFPYPTLHIRPSAPELVRGFFESLGFALRANLEQLANVLRSEPERLILSGGMTRNTTLLQILADVINRPLLVAREAESAALGCAMLVACQGKSDSLSPVARSWVDHELVSPRADRERYDERYAIWRRLYEQMFEMEL